MSLSRKLLIVITVSMVTTACNPRFQAIKREIPPVGNIIPLPTLCKKAALSDNPKVVALSNKYCAVANQTKLRDASDNYKRLAQCYSTGECG